MMAEQGFLERLLNGLEEDIGKSLDECGAKHHATKNIIEYHSKIVALDGDYPDEAIDLKGVDVKYKSKILKAELRSVFPDQTFSVRISRYSGGSSIHVTWKDEPMLAEDESQYHQIIGKYSYEYPDSNPMMDYCHVDNFTHGQGPSYKPPKKKSSKNHVGGDFVSKYRVFDQVLRAIDKEEAATDEHWLIKSLREDRSTVEGLEGKFPTEAIQLKSVDVKYKARILRAELKDRFPDLKFSVRIDRFSGGSAIDVRWEHMPGSEEEREEYEQIIDKYSYEYPDSNILVDYCHVDNFARGQGPWHKDLIWKRRVEE